MSRRNFIKYYVPCSEAQRTKIEVLRNERRLEAWRLRYKSAFYAAAATTFDNIRAERLRNGC